MNEIELIDISDNLLIINKTTVDRLFSEDNQNALVLYLFYYKTAKWQKHNPIKANDVYCKKCLHWGIDKLQNTKKKLNELKLIETIKRTNDKGQIEGWYIRVNYYTEKTTIPETAIPVSPQLDSQETNTINNNINTNNNNKLYSKKFIPPSLEEVKEYCESRNNNVDYQMFYDYYTTGDWKDAKGNKVKNWKQKVITWEKNKMNKQEYKTGGQRMDDLIERMMQKDD